MRILAIVLAMAIFWPLAVVLLCVWGVGACADPVETDGGQR